MRMDTAAVNAEDIGHPLKRHAVYAVCTTYLAGRLALYVKE